MTPAAAAAGFITVYPDGIDGTWGTEDVLLVHNLIWHLAGHLSVDTDRVYVAGFSAGEADTVWLPDLVDDGTRAWTEQWTDCQRDAEVMLYGIEGGGHIWPSGPGPLPLGLVTQEISSTEIVEFLERHTLR